jgi:hypothetical protein
MTQGAENSPEHSNTTLENQALIKSGDSYLGRAVIAQEQQGSIPTDVFENASRFYEDVLTGDTSPAVLARDALCLEGLAEANPTSPEAQDLRDKAKAEIELGLRGLEGATDEAPMAPLLVVGAKIAVAEGDSQKALDILGSLNGSTPPEVAILAAELQDKNILPLGHVVETLLEISRVA